MDGVVVISMNAKILPKSRIVRNPKDFVLIPSFVLKDRSLSVLEAMVEYLKDAKGLTFHEIAIMTNRNDRTVWTVYMRAKKKRKMQ